MSLQAFRVKVGKILLWGTMKPMEQEKKKCMLCGKAVPLKGGICDPCQERIRREAMGEQADIRSQAEKELKKHGVTPDRGGEKK